MRLMDKALTATIAANRFGLGARPGELASIGRSGPDWLRAQLDGPAPEIADDGLQSSASVLVRIYDLRRTIRAEREGGTNAGSPSGAGNDAAAVKAFKKLPQLVRPIYLAEAGARLR
ncbi:MAG: hypothetical protein WBV35_16520, partial [Steroidobacteraceae bacterium]